MKTGAIIAIAVGLALLLGGCEFVQERNKLAAEREAIRGEWSQVDADLQRRADLIPNLVETVKGYATHEKSTLEAVTNARAAASSARTVDEKVQADNMLSGALRQLFAVAEAYPDLKANTNFLQLQTELGDIENKLAAARRYFNSAVREYNTGREQFPAALIAGAFGFAPRASFDLGENRAAAEVAPKVSFN